MKKKKHPRSSSSSAYAAAILAGGVLFTGPATNATIVFSEDFESAANAFGMPTYAYSQNYTLPNYLAPSGGLQYATGGNGVNGQVSTNPFALPAPLSLTQGTGVTANQIDNALASFDFRAQFSTYRQQNDYAEVLVTFLDEFSTPIGDPIILGGQTFVSGLASGPGATLPDARAWGESTFQGLIPAGARTISVLVSGTKTPGGMAIDSYLDTVVLNVESVPEPTTLALGVFAGLAWLRRRRR